MATDASLQRAYRAACPNCGAPVEFRSAASAFAVCSFCRSTLVREGDALRKIGESAELFDDHSPLQLGASGRYQGAPFTLVGRLQYRYAEGSWNEWHALFDSGADSQKSGWLSEDNGRYVLAFERPPDRSAPAAEGLTTGSRVVVDGSAWDVASVAAARLIAAQGELPHKPELAHSFVVVDLRSPAGEVGTLDYSAAAAPRWSVGRSVALGQLAMTGLAAAAEKTLKARSAACPNCGAALAIKLETTQAIVCQQCHAVVDVSAGMGGDLRHYVQENGSEPQIPLGSIGSFAFGGARLLPWQVVGYVERCTVPGGEERAHRTGRGVADDQDDDGDDDDDAQSFWREYLVYHRTEGFTFIVDAEDGWSWTAPITGVPERFGDSVKYDGVLYRKLYDYTGKVTYVLGEFYWQVKRNQLTRNADYRGSGDASSRRMNREQTDSGDTHEVVWSAGQTLSVYGILTAFHLAPEKAAQLQRDASPTFDGAATLMKVFSWVCAVAVVLIMFRCGYHSGGADCESIRLSYGDASQEYQSCLNSNRSGSGQRTGGGSYGGFSSGGGHK